MKSIVMIGTLDTKGSAIEYVKQRIEKRGHKAIVIDAGILSKPKFQADFSREETAKAGGKSLRELVDAAMRGVNRANATEVMIRGVVKIAKELYDSGKLDGIFSLGGSTGTSIGTAAMRALPLGVPKIMVCSLSKDVSSYVGTKDLVMMNSVVDIIGLNAMTKKILSNAADAIVGMVEGEKEEYEDKPPVAITSLGVTTPAVLNAQALLQGMGYDVLVFSPWERKTLYELIEEGLIKGILDLTIYELIPRFIHRNLELPGGEIDRFDLANRQGIPQVIIPGGLDMVIFAGKNEDIPSEFRSRRLHVHGQNITLARTTAEEMAELGKIVAEKANEATGPVGIIIPLKGFSAVDRESHEFYDPRADEAFAKAVKENVKRHVSALEVNVHINDYEFAKRISAILDNFMKKKRK